MFPADRLRRFPDNPLPGQAASEPGPVSGAGKLEDEYEVEEVTASRLYYGKLQYRVIWRGWDPTEDWEPARNLRNAPLAVEAFHQAHPTEAGPPKRLQAWLDAYENDVELEDHTDDDKPSSPAPGSRRRLGRRRG